MAELGQHSLLQNCVELLRAIEKLPASPAQQELLDQAGDLMAALAEELRSHREGRQFLLKLIGRAPLPDEDHQLIRQLALAYGFTLREQSDGKKDLNGYVYAFGQALLEAAREQSRKQRRAAKTPGPGHLP